MDERHSYDAVKLYQMGYGYVGDGQDIVRMTDEEVAELAHKAGGTIQGIEMARMCD
jgi:hypothetical protein